MEDPTTATKINDESPILIFSGERNQRNSGTKITSSTYYLVWTSRLFVDMYARFKIMFTYIEKKIPLTHS